MRFHWFEEYYHKKPISKEILIYQSLSFLFSITSINSEWLLDANT